MPIDDQLPPNQTPPDLSVPDLSAGSRPGGGPENFPESSGAHEIPDLASFRRRTAAFTIDFALLSIVMFAVERMVTPTLMAPENQLWAMEYLLKAMQGTTGEKMVVVGVLVGAMVLLLIPFDLYFIIFEYLMGATIGKRLLRIRVESLDTAPLKLRQCWMREIFRHVDFLLVIPAVGGIIFGGRKQRLGDWAAGTIVLNVPDLPPWEVPGRRPPDDPDFPQDSDHQPPLPRI